MTLENNFCSLYQTQLAFPDFLKWILLFAPTWHLHRLCPLPRKFTGPFILNNPPHYSNLGPIITQVGIPTSVFFLLPISPKFCISNKIHLYLFLLSLSFLLKQTLLNCGAPSNIYVGAVGVEMFSEKCRIG